MKLAGVHHVSLNVDDVETTGRFYQDVLGLELLPRPDFKFPGMWLRAQGQELHLIQVENHSAPDGQHFALRVEDLDGALSELASKGIDAAGPFAIEGVCRQAFFKDPAGNLIELNEPGTAD